MGRYTAAAALLAVAAAVMVGAWRHSAVCGYWPSNPDLWVWALAGECNR